MLNPLTGVEGTAQSASFMLPPAISQLVKGGMELGDADDQVCPLADVRCRLVTVVYFTHLVASEVSYAVRLTVAMCV